MFVRPLLLFQVLIFYNVAVTSKKARKPLPFVQISPGAKYDNPNAIKDRVHDRNQSKPQMPVAWNERKWQPFDPAWMDYCDKIHCADYFRNVCGLNRKTMRFKWFQSTCHLSINNQCAYHRGLLKYDIVDTKFCYIYVMQIRSGCPQACEDAVAPVCALDHHNRVLLFKNRCALEKANCGSLVEKFEEVYMSVCDYHWRKTYSKNK